MNKKQFWDSLNDEQKDFVVTCTFIQQAINTFNAALEKQPEGGVIPFKSTPWNNLGYWDNGINRHT